MVIRVDLFTYKPSENTQIGTAWLLMHDCVTGVNLSTGLVDEQLDSNYPHGNWVWAGFEIMPPGAKLVILTYMQFSLCRTLSIAGPAPDWLRTCSSKWKHLRLPVSKMCGESSGLDQNYNKFFLKIAKHNNAT